LIRQDFSWQDKRLAELLVRGKEPKRIAREMWIPASKVYNRIHRLKKLGAVSSRGYLVDFENLGYNIAALIVARTRGPNADSIVNRQGARLDLCVRYFRLRSGRPVSCASAPTCR